MVEKESHELSNMALQVSGLHPRPPPLLVEGHVEPCCLLLRDASPSADARTIEDFVEHEAGCKLKKIDFALEPGKAMLVFDGEPSE